MSNLPVSRLLAATALAFLVGACSGDSPTVPQTDQASELSNVTADTEIHICKVSWATQLAGGDPAADDGTLGETFRFDASAPAGASETNVGSVAGLRANDPTTLDCQPIWSGPAGTRVTITETGVDNPNLDFFLNSVSANWGSLINPAIDFENKTVSFDAPAANVADFQLNVRFKNTVSEIPDVGGQGCTPGYWRQPQHEGNWVGYAPVDFFDDVFGVSYGGTLLEAVWARGGGENALARHAVAALLNAENGDVAYDLSTGEIIAMVQAAFASGDYESAKNILEGYNEQGCDLGRA